LLILEHSIIFALQPQYDEPHPPNTDAADRAAQRRVVIARAGEHQRQRNKFRGAFTAYPIIASASEAIHGMAAKFSTGFAAATMPAARCHGVAFTGLCLLAQRAPAKAPGNI
jgi:hypothetical protein